MREPIDMDVHFQLADEQKSHAQTRAEVARLNLALEHAAGRVEGMESEVARLNSEVARLTRSVDAAATIERASQRTIESGNEAFRMMREQWQSDRDTLRREVSRLRTIVDVVVRIVELDEICNAHPSNTDPIGNAAESELYEVVTKKTQLIANYRASKEIP